MRAIYLPDTLISFADISIKLDEQSSRTIRYPARYTEMYSLRFRCWNVRTRLLSRLLQLSGRRQPHEHACKAECVTSKNGRRYKVMDTILTPITVYFRNTDPAATNYCADVSSRVWLRGSFGFSLPLLGALTRVANFVWVLSGRFSVSSLGTYNWFKKHFWLVTKICWSKSILIEHNPAKNTVKPLKDGTPQRRKPLNDGKKSCDGRFSHVK